VVRTFAGGGIGAALVLIGWTSYKEYLDNKNAAGTVYRSPTYAYTVVSLVLTLLTTVVMFGRYQETEKLFPAGAVAGISLLMLVFYVYKLFFSRDVGSSAARAYEHND